ncbi:alpha/beta hydrolase [Aestuariicella hydrocarbonica]|uniref:Alpha/beta hydrolase n=1 Tax=Pseudomaricurvus hydrocarbonicus TaxID=1470433 RepID=A0A9E5T3L7_9GAMM|nr:alpha/beta hydrolase [Aestuariicella hydrocarbonica]NHO67278.1 alpha/beta hydrolase [Aestuariicella hydrocarbonica]
MAVIWRGIKYTLLMAVVAVLLSIVWVLIRGSELSPERLQERHYDFDVQSMDIDGVRVHYQDVGEGPVLLLIHSHFFAMTQWDQWVPALSQHYRVIRYDMRSHGLTGPDPVGDYSMASSQQLVQQLLQRLDVDRFSVVGTSLGGNVAFHLAAGLPQRVEKLVLINSGGLKRDNARSGTIPGWVDYAVYLIPRWAYKNFLQWMVIDDQLVTDANVDEFYDMFRRQGNRPGEMERLRDFNVGEPDALLASIAAPTLVLWGEENPQLPSGLAYDFQDRLTNSACVWVKLYPGIGHVLPIESPEEGVTDVLAFLQDKPLPDMRSVSIKAKGQQLVATDTDVVNSVCL